jgi:predicted 3-demethylubiquinone-9 3-methyltransferase (glyoxalase superfamily)
MQKITTFLTFDNQAEEAAKFYTSIFENSKIVRVVRYGDAGPGPKGSVLTVEFELAGQKYVALNGGPHFSFSEGISLSVDCKTQEEIDRYSARLTEGGEQGPCGWVKDKFGVSWQVNPSMLADMFASPDADKAARAMEAMLKMKKLDIATLMRAYEG